jgi:hypothetical protein
MSGSALVDPKGKLVGLVAKGQTGIGRCVPVEYVKELLAEASMNVTISPAVPVPGEEFKLTIAPSGPAESFVLATASFLSSSLPRPADFKMRAVDSGAWTGKYKLPAVADNGTFALRIVAKTRSGLSIERMARLAGVAQIKATIHSVKVTAKKAGGSAWDLSGGNPDVFYKVFIDGNLRTTTERVRNTFKHQNSTEFDCISSQQIAIEVFDADLARNDFVGRIFLPANPETGFGQLHLAEQQIERAEITLRPVPLRWPKTQK